MNNVLTNPAWHALSTGNAQLAQGNSRIKYFDKQVSPFVGFEENTTDHLVELAGMVTDAGISIFISEEKVNIPPELQSLACVNCYQLVWNGATLPPDSEETVIELDETHIPEMLALTQLTNPGPFSPQTIKFGHYRGIYADGKLVAMAGQRLNPSPYAEISAVCTHPDYLGKGHAKTLLNHHINRVTTASGIPYLHVKHDNERAIKVYKSLGFEVSRELLFNVIQKAV